jgi:hypothetical protein
MPIQTLRSPAWLLSGLTQSVAGELILKDGRLIFETGDRDRIFDAPLGEISAKFPWYYFSGGMKLRIGTDDYRVSFTRPGNLPDHSGSDAGAGDVRSGRESGAAWKSALAALTTTR